jgi:hypothetical protein
VDIFGYIGQGQENFERDWQIKKGPATARPLIKEFQKHYLKSTTSTPGYLFLSNAKSASDTEALGFRELMV